MLGALRPTSLEPPLQMVSRIIAAVGTVPETCNLIRATVTPLSTGSSTKIWLSNRPIGTSFFCSAKPGPLTYHPCFVAGSCFDADRLIGAPGFAHKPVFSDVATSLGVFSDLATSLGRSLQPATSTPKNTETTRKLVFILRKLSDMITSSK